MSNIPHLLGSTPFTQRKAFGVLAPPRGRRRLNVKHPSVQGLLWYGMNDDQGVHRDLVRPYLTPSAIGSTAPTQSAWGQGARKTTYANADTTHLALTSGPFSILTAFYVDVSNPTDFTGMIGRVAYTDESTNSGWQIQKDQSVGRIRNIINANNGSSFYANTDTSITFSIGAPTLTSCQYHCFGIISQPSAPSLVSWHNDGPTSGQINTSSGSKNYSPAATTGDLIISDPSGSIETLVTAIWNRPITNKEIQAFFYDPYMMAETPDVSMAIYGQQAATRDDFYAWQTR